MAQDPQAPRTVFQIPALDNFLHVQNDINKAHLEQAQTRRTAEADQKQWRSDERLRRWVEEEAEQVTLCEGGSTKAVREWIQAIRGAKPRVPLEQCHHRYMTKLASKTSRGELHKELERFKTANAQAIQIEQLLEHLLDSFLGPDEAEALKDEVKKVRQAPREEIPTFCRRFRGHAELAYPNPDQEEDAHLAGLFLAGLKGGRLQDKLFDANPRLNTMNAVIAAATSEWGRQRYKNRVLQESRAVAAAASGHEPMEVDALQSSPTARDLIAKQEQKIKALEKQLGALQTSSCSNKDNRTSQDKPERLCFWCEKPGHMKRDCPKRRNFWTTMGGDPRPLTVEERRQAKHLGN